MCPEFCEFLVRCGATSMSVNPDTVVYTRRLVASLKQKVLLERMLEQLELCRRYVSFDHGAGHTVQED